MYLCLGPEQVASISCQIEVVWAFVIQSKTLGIHVHASIAFRTLGSSRGMKKGQNQHNFSKSTNFLIHQNFMQVSLSLQMAVI